MRALTLNAGNLAADHRHLYTAETLHYQAAFRRNGNEVAWNARVRLAGEVVGELAGVTPIGHEAGSVLEVVRGAVDDEIDRHLFV
jgi:hypothetical protein